MATVTLEIPDEQDLKLVLALAKRLNLRCYVDTEEKEDTDSGEARTAEQVGQHPDAAVDEPGAIPLEEFIQKMQSWK